MHGHAAVQQAIARHPPWERACMARGARRGRDGIGDGLWVWVGGHPSGPVIKFKRVTVTQALLLQGCPRLNLFYFITGQDGCPPTQTYPILSHPGPPARRAKHARSTRARWMVEGGNLPKWGGLCAR